MLKKSIHVALAEAVGASGIALPVLAIRTASLVFNVAAQALAKSRGCFDDTEKGQKTVQPIVAF